MSITADVNKAYYEHLDKNHRKPDTVYLTETSFLYLALEMISLNPESSQLQRMLQLIKREGAIEAAKKIRYKEMHIVVQEQGKRRVHVRDNKHVSKDDNTIDITGDKEQREAVRSIFDSVFGKDGMFDRIFGGGSQ